MSNESTSPTRVPRVALVLLVLLSTLTLGATVAGAPAATAACPINDPDCGPPDPSPPDPPAENHIWFSWTLTQLRADSYGAVIESQYDKSSESKTSPVTLDACGSTAAGGTDWPGISAYRWTFDDGSAPITTTTCSTTWNRALSANGTTTNVTLTVVPEQGSPFSLTRTVAYRDVVIASLGDSAASGEGAPQDGPQMWAAHYCGRSGWAANAQAALRVQRALANTTVHLWDLTCAGASITADGSGWWAQQTGQSNPGSWGGMLDSYLGTYDNIVLDPQVDRLEKLQSDSGLAVDRLLLTVGANDTHWATLLQWCLPFGLDPTTLAEHQCIDHNASEEEDAVRALPSHFSALADGLRERLTPQIPADRIALEGYFDPMDSLAAQPAICAAEPLAQQYLRTWAVTHVENFLQADVQAAATSNRWHYIDGIRQAFQGHGVCQSSGRYINTYAESLAEQHDDRGTWHANRTGQLRMADIITPYLMAGVQLSAPDTSIISGPATLTNGRNATLGFTSTNGTSFQCQLDGAGWTACGTGGSGTASYAGLADGRHTVQVRALNGAGADGTPASWTWDVDTVAPQTAITSAPPAWLLTPSATVTYASSEAGSTFTCTFDGAPATCGPTGYTASGPTATTHVFAVAATDQARNRDATPAQATFTVPRPSSDLTLGAGWRLRSSTGSYRDRFAVATRAGSAMSTRASGVRRLALVASTGPGFGTAKVYLGSTLLRTVSLAARTLRTEQIIPVATFGAAKRGAVRVVVASNGKQVRIEGIGLARR